MCFRLALLGLKNMCLRWKTNVGHLGSLMIISICSFNLSYILILILSWFFLDHFEFARSIYLFRRRWGIASKRSIRKFPSKCEQLEISFLQGPLITFKQNHSAHYPLSHQCISVLCLLTKAYFVWKQIPLEAHEMDLTLFTIKKQKSKLMDMSWQSAKGWSQVLTLWCLQPTLTAVFTKLV